MAHRSTRRTGTLGVVVLGLVAKQFGALVLMDVPLVALVEPALLATVLVQLAPAMSLRGRALVAWVMLLDLAVSALVLADAVYYRLTQNLLSVQQLPLALHLRQLGPAVQSGIQTSDLWLLLDVPVLAWALWHWRGSQPYRKRWAALTAAAGLGLFAGTVWIDPHWHRAGWRNPGGAGHVGVVGFHALNGAYGLLLDLHALGDSPGDLSALRAWYAARRPAPVAPLVSRPLPFQNVIVLQVESLQQAVMGMRIEGQEVTPSLNRLAARAVAFDHAYSQVAAGNTSDAEWLSLCSLYPESEGVAFRRQARAHLNCLPALARAHGRKTLGFHGNATDVYGRRWMYPAIGVERFLLGSDFKPGEQRGLGLSDDAVFSQALQNLARLPAGAPFFAEVITLTSHTPFDDVPHTLNLGPLEGTRTGAYLQSISYTDAAIGHFVDGLEKAGLLEHTLLVIYGDHVGISHRDPRLELLPVDLQSDAARFDFDRRVPLLLLGKGLGPEVIHTPVGQLDIAPTAAALMGIDASHAGFLGRDLLATAPRPVVFGGGSVIDTERLLLVGRHQAPACIGRGEKTLFLEECADLEAYAARERDMGQRLIDGDLMRLISH